MRIFGKFLAICLFIITVHNYANTIGFIDDWNLPDNLTSGSLQGLVMFVQDTTKIPGYNLHEHPITPLRDTLFAFIPKNKSGGDYKITIFDANHHIRNQFALLPPSLIPPSDEPQLSGKPRVEFSTKAYTAVIPAKAFTFPLKGLSIEITDKKSGSTGTVGASTLIFGVPAHAIMHNIRIGELTQPPDRTAQELDFELTANYLQTIPASKLTVDNYSPLKLNEIVDVEGHRYTGKLPGKGDVYGGKAEYFARRVIAPAILIANNGYLLAHEVKNWTPSLTRVNMLIKGKYENGIVRHGLHCIGAMTFLTSTDLNEYSHELGHTFGLADYEGGQLGGHKHTDGWAFDAYNNMFLSVLEWGASPADVLGEKPFQNIFSYGKDAMSGGGNNYSDISRYTLYTPNSLKIIAKTFQNSTFFQQNKQGKYRLYGFDPVNEKMTDKSSDDSRLPVSGAVPVVTIAGYYDPSKKIFPNGAYILPAMFSSYGYVFSYNTPKSNDCSLIIKMKYGNVQKIALPNTNFSRDEGNLFAVNVPTINKPDTVSVFCPSSSKPLFIRDITYPSTNPFAISVGGNKGYTDVVKHAFGFTFHIQREIFEPNIVISFNRLPAQYLTQRNIEATDPSGNNLSLTIQPTTSALTYRALLPFNAISGVYKVHLHNFTDKYGNAIDNKSERVIYTAIPQVIIKRNKKNSRFKVDLSKLAHYINNRQIGQRLAYIINRDFSQMLSGPDTYSWDSTKKTSKTTTLIKVLDLQNNSIGFRIWNGKHVMNSFANWGIKRSKMYLQIANVKALPRGVIKGRLHFIARWWNKKVNYPFAVNYVIYNDKLPQNTAISARGQKGLNIKG